MAEVGAWSSILAWDIDVENDPAIKVAKVYYEMLLAHGISANIAALTKADVGLRQQPYGPNMKVWPLPSSRSRCEQGMEQEVASPDLESECAE